MLILYDNANKIPKKVATPFPPLNFNQIGKRCPRKTNKADNCNNSGKNCLVIKTGIYPFNISKNKSCRKLNICFRF